MDGILGNVYAGIDPGKLGFIAVYSDKWQFYPIPRIGSEVDVHTLHKIIFSLNVKHIVIEDVHAIYGSSASSTFEFGRIVGILEALLVASGIPFTKVQPKIWQKEMLLGVPVIKKKKKNDTKKMAELAARRLFPDVDLRRTTRCTTVDDNKVDAMLLAEYCRRNYC